LSKTAGCHQGLRRPIPEPETLSRSALNDVYDATRLKVDELIRSASPDVVGMTTDMWTDNYRRRSYIAYTLHFISPDFTLHSLTLKTSVFQTDHTGENIKADMLTTHSEFNLDDKKIVYVTDQGANIVKACKLALVERFGCIAHGLHNLVVKDGLSKVAQLQDIINKAKAVVTTLNYKAALMEKEDVAIETEKFMEKLDAVTKELELNEQQELFAEKPKAAHTKTTLKKDCPTRWNCTLALLQSLCSNRLLVVRCLQNIRAYDKIPEDGEWETMEELSKFLQVFKTATEVLNGEKYPTSGLVVILKAEIERALVDQPTDSDCIGELKRNMRDHLNKRMPTTELQVCAAILDPSMRNMAALQEYMISNNTTGANFLLEMITKYGQAGEPENATSATSTSGLPDDQNSGDQQPWKKLKLDMLARYSATTDTVDREIQQYRCLATNGAEDPCAW